MKKMQLPKHPYTVYLNSTGRDVIQLSDIHGRDAHWVQGLDLDDNWIWIPTAAILYMQYAGDDSHESE